MACLPEPQKASDEGRVMLPARVRTGGLNILRAGPGGRSGPPPCASGSRTQQWMQKHYGLFTIIGKGIDRDRGTPRSEEHTSELQSIMRISYAVFCLKKKKKDNKQNRTQ